jgi:hypothetical protein
VNHFDFVRPSLSKQPSRVRTLAAGAVVLALALAVSACSAGVQAVDGDGRELTFSVAAPADGAEVSIPFDVTVESSVSLGAPESGNHHLHLYFDTDTDSADYDIVYGDTAQVSRQLAPGEHTIIVSLRNPDHSDTGLSQTLSVVVTGDVGDGAAPDPVATPPSFGY